MRYINSKEESDELQTVSRFLNGENSEAAAWTLLVLVGSTRELYDDDVVKIGCWGSRRTREGGCLIGA